ncbi:MAG: thioredoxin family protein, partial [Leptospiraceae bacterium]|nr:thioredoxin family protein [Leptospiraceae bacterium]
MKLLIFFLFFAFKIIADETSSLSLEEGFKISKEREVPLFVEFYTDWCRFCKVLDSKIIPHPTIQESLQNFQPVRVNGDTEKALIQKYQIRGYPTIIILDFDGSILGKIEGLPPVEFLNNKLRYALAKKEEKASLLKQIEQEPNSPIPLYNLARLYYEQEQYEKSHNFSLKSYHNSNEVLTKKKEALFLIGMSLFRLHKFPESISIWNQYLIDYPEDEGIILYYRGIS